MPFLAPIVPFALGAAAVTGAVASVVGLSKNNSAQKAQKSAQEKQTRINNVNEIKAVTAEVIGVNSPEFLSFFEKVNESPEDGENARKLSDEAIQTFNDRTKEEKKLVAENILVDAESKNTPLDIPVLTELQADVSVLQDSINSINPQMNPQIDIGKTNRNILLIGGAFIAIIFVMIKKGK